MSFYDFFPVGKSTGRHFYGDVGKKGCKLLESMLFEGEESGLMPRFEGFETKKICDRYLEILVIKIICGSYQFLIDVKSIKISNDAKKKFEKPYLQHR